MPREGATNSLSRRDRRVCRILSPQCAVGKAFIRRCLLPFHRTGVVQRFSTWLRASAHRGRSRSSVRDSVTDRLYASYAFPPFGDGIVQARPRRLSVRFICLPSSYYFNRFVRSSAFRRSWDSSSARPKHEDRLKAELRTSFLCIFGLMNVEWVDHCSCSKR